MTPVLHAGSIYYYAFIRSKATLRQSIEVDVNAVATQTHVKMLHMYRSGCMHLNAYCLHSDLCTHFCTHAIFSHETVFGCVYAAFTSINCLHAARGRCKSKNKCGLPAKWVSTPILLSLQVFSGSSEPVSFVSSLENCILVLEVNPPPGAKKSLLLFMGSIGSLLPCDCAGTW